MTHHFGYISIPCCLCDYLWVYKLLYIKVKTAMRFLFQRQWQAKPREYNSSLEQRSEQPRRCEYKLVVYQKSL